MESSLLDFFLKQIGCRAGKKNVARAISILCRRLNAARVYFADARSSSFHAITGRTDTHKNGQQQGKSSLRLMRIFANGANQPKMAQYPQQLKSIFPRPPCACHRPYVAILRRPSIRKSGLRPQPTTETIAPVVRSHLCPSVLICG